MSDFNSARLRVILAFVSGELCGLVYNEDAEYGGAFPIADLFTPEQCAVLEIRAQKLGRHQYVEIRDMAITDEASIEELINEQA